MGKDSGKKQKDQTYLKTLLDSLGKLGRRLAGLTAPAKSAEPVVLRPQGKERGCVVISYITWPFREGWDVPKARGHTNAFEMVAMAEAWCDQGFRVEVCEYTNETYSPPSNCVVAIDLHSNLERWQENLPAGCLKILHATGCHWRIHNKSELDRLAALRERRGVSLQPRRQVDPSRAAEISDEITVLGNEHTIGTYGFAGKTITRIPISSAYEFDWPKAKDFEQAKRRFLWLGSHGMVHKGLDLVLEAFAGMPDAHLTVCGRPEKEADFFQAYEKELTKLPNIELHGWVDLRSPEFAQIASTHGTIIYPSSCEGGGGSVIHCMHASLLPACTSEASVDLAGFGVLLERGDVAAVQRGIERVLSMAGRELEQRSLASWEHAREMHTRTRFSESYRSFAGRILGSGGIIRP